MDSRQIVKNTAVAFLAQGVAIVTSICTTLLVPKILGTEQYAYWQLFILYQSYIGFCHLGLNDGIYLINGGKTRDEINKRSINSQLLVITLFQTCIGIAVIVALMFADLGPERLFVIACTAIYMPLKNIASLLGYVLQCMNEVIRFSAGSMIERACCMVPLVILILLRVDSFELYVVIYLISAVCEIAAYFWFMRDFPRAGIDRLCKALGDSFASIRVGVKLLCANLASQFVLGIASFVVDAVWGIEAFGQVSLAFSMVNFILIFASQAAMVLFPALRQSDESEQKRYYVAARNALTLVLPAIYLLYFPACWLIGMWLPAYSDSLVFFGYLIPICVFDMKMNLTCTTLFKVRREEDMLLKVNVATMAVSVVGALIGAYAFNSIYMVVSAVVVAIVLRSSFSELYFTRAYALPSAKPLMVGELVITGAFVVLVASGHLIEAFVLTLMAYSLHLFVNRSVLQSFLHGIHG